MSPRVLDPLVDVVETAAEVLPLMRARTARGGGWISSSAPKPCKTCGVERELRYGHCFRCALEADAGRDQAS